MRTLALVLLFLAGSMNASCETTRLSRIHPGMTRTEVAIELGRPADVRVDRETTLWIYPASDSQICMIKFVKQRVTQEVMTCDNTTEASRELASHTAFMLPKMNSDLEYQERVKRYCGLKPKPRPGCRIDQCVNGGWEEVCN